LRLGCRIVPAHLARLLDEQSSALDDLLAEHAAFVGVGEVGGEVLNAVVFSLQRRRELGRCGVRGACDGLPAAERRTDRDRASDPRRAAGKGHELTITCSDRGRTGDWGLGTGRYRRTRFFPGWRA